jgi:hypothetical protein
VKQIALLNGGRFLPQLRDAGALALDKLHLSKTAGATHGLEDDSQDKGEACNQACVPALTAALRHLRPRRRPCCRRQASPLSLQVH